MSIIGIALLVLSASLIVLEMHTLTIPPDRGRSLHRRRYGCAGRWRAGLDALIHSHSGRGSPAISALDKRASEEPRQWGAIAKESSVMIVPQDMGDLSKAIGTALRITETVKSAA